MAEQIAIQNNESSTAMIRQLKASEKQYDTLSKEEEQALIDEWWDKDRDHCRELLIMHNLRIVFSMSKKYALKTHDFDDMVARGFFGLVTAAQRFEPDKGNKFITYATPWVFKYMVGQFYDKDDQVSAASIRLNTFVNEDKTAGDDQSGATYENFIEEQIDPTYQRSVKDTESQINENDTHSIYEHLIDYVKTSVDFNPTDREVFQRAFVDHDTVKQISVDLGINVSEVNKSKKMILDKFKQRLKDRFSINSWSDLAPAFC